MKESWIESERNGVYERLAPKTHASAVYMRENASQTLVDFMHSSAVNIFQHVRTADNNNYNGVHNFIGAGNIGRVQLTADYTPDIGDTIRVNGEPVRVYANDGDIYLQGLKHGAWVFFTLNEDHNSEPEIRFYFDTWTKAFNTPTKRYGIRIDKNIGDPVARCSYMYQAVGKAPARMDYANGVFDYGDWADVGFVKDNRPVMLDPQGNVVYELDPDDMTKKLDGTPSDVENVNTDPTAGSVGLNAMSEMPLWWMKQSEDDQYVYIEVCDIKFDDDFTAFPFIRADGTLASHLYLPIYQACQITDGAVKKLRSLSGRTMTVSQTATNEIAQAQANGSGWDAMAWCEWDYVNALLVLLGCTTDTQTAFGTGVVNTLTPQLTGQLDKKGQFFGYADTYGAMKVFFCENWWGNGFKRISGLIANASKKIMVKMTPPYVVAGTGYADSGVTGPGAGYVKTLKVTANGKIPSAIGGTASTYYTDYQAATAASTYARIGGYATGANNETQAGAFGINFALAHGTTNANTGTAIAYRQPSATTE
jgi:hypothetical protein